MVKKTTAKKPVRKKVARQHSPRSLETRAATSRPSDAYIPPSVIPVPNPQPGYVYRWIRTSTYGKADNTNVSRQFREGWVPVRAEDHPELAVQSDRNSEFEGNVEVGGLLLCKAPIEQVERRRKFYEDLSIQQMESVDQNYLRENDPRMPLLSPERKTRTSFGRG